MNRKYITQQMIKEFTPLLGYISWSSFQWIICIILSKCSKMFFTILKIPKNHVTCQLSNNCLPHHRTSCHIIIHMNCTDCTVNILFLPVFHFEQNSISLAPNICLNPNKLHWVAIPFATERPMLSFNLKRFQEL
jgi:hypothetical protein